METGNKTKKIVIRILSNLIIALGAIIILLPLLNILILSVSDQAEYNKNILSFISGFKAENYVLAWKRARMPLYTYNTVVVMITSLIGVIFTSSLCAYAISRYSRFREINSVYYIIISGMFIPIQAIILPIFQQLKTVGLLNNLFGLSLIYMGTTMSLSMMIFTGFFKSIPKELDEAAAIDGLNQFQIFIKIILPLSGTPLATVSILAGLTIWRDFFVPLVAITTPEKKTLGVGLLAFVDEFSLDMTQMSAAMVMQTIPILVLFLFLQRYFISGIVSGAVKG